MNYFRYLKKGLYFYVAGGMLFGLALLALVVLYRYNNSLNKVLDTANAVSGKQGELSKEIGEIDALVKYLMDNFSLDSPNANSEKIILRAFDDMKTRLDSASLTAARFEDANGEKKLPVEIKILVKNYKMIIDDVGYMESFRFPDYRIRNLSITKEQTGGVALTIQGEFVIPLKEQKPIPLIGT